MDVTWFRALAIASAAGTLLAPLGARAEDDAPAPTATANATATPVVARAADPSFALGANELRALEYRLDALTQQNAAQETEIAQLRARLSRVVVPGATNAANAANAAGDPASARPATTSNVAVNNGPTGAEKPLKAAPKARSVESIYQQQNAAFVPRLTLTPSITSTFSDNRYFTLNGFLALNAIFLGNVNVTQQRNDVRIAALDATYGLAPFLEIEASVPYYMRGATFSSVGANFAGEAASQDSIRAGGVGDVQVGAYAQIHRESATAPGITLNTHVSIPTGRAPYGIAMRTDAANTNLQFPSTLPTGSGVYGYEFGASFVKSSDPAIFFGGVNYYLQTPMHFDNLQFTPAHTKTPGFAQPGDSVQYQIGTAFALNEKTSLSFAFVETVSNSARIHPDRGIESSLVGSATNAAVLDISAGFASNAHQTLITDLQLGLTQDAPSFQLGFRFPTRF